MSPWEKVSTFDPKSLPAGVPPVYFLRATDGSGAVLPVTTKNGKIDSTGILRSSRGQVDAVEVDNIMTVSIRYDATSDPLLNLPFVPTPGRTMTAKGIAMIGGL